VSEALLDATFPKNKIKSFALGKRSYRVCIYQLLWNFIRGRSPLPQDMRALSLL